MAGSFQIFLNEPSGLSRHGDEADFIALTFNAQVQDPLAMLEIADAEFTKLLPAQAVIKKRRQDRPIPLAL